MNIHGLQCQDLDELKMIMGAIDDERYNPCMRRIAGGFVRVCLGGFDGNVLTINLFYGAANGDDTESYMDLVHEENRLPLTLLRDKALTIQQKLEAMGKWTSVAMETSEKKIDVDESGMIRTKTVTVLVEPPRKDHCSVEHAEPVPRPDSKAVQ